MNRPLKDIFLDEVKKEFGDIVMLAANQESITLSEGGEVRPELELIFEAASSIMPISEALKKQITEARESAADKDFATVDALSAEAKRLLDEKEAQMGPEIFDGAMRYVALQSLDVLWMEHLETMDHLRDSVRLRGWGQRDPLVEYKREGFELFERLVKEINKQIVYTVFKVGVVTEQAIEAPKPVVLQSAEGTVSSDSAPVDPKFEGVGRNDTCPCGSGKKFKKCHGQNA
jgi:preprotein translocase subunit SecA